MTVFATVVGYLVLAFWALVLLAAALLALRGAWQAHRRRWRAEAKVWSHYDQARFEPAAREAEADRRAIADLIESTRGRP